MPETLTDATSSSHRGNQSAPPGPADQIATVLGWLGLAVLAYVTFRIVQPFFTPLGWAAVFAIVAHPLQRRVEGRWGRSGAALVSTLIVAVVLVAPALFVTSVLVSEAVEGAAAFQAAIAEGRLAWAQNWWAGLTDRLPGSAQVDVSAAASDLVRRGAAALAAQSGYMLRDAAIFTVNLAIALFATFFLLRDSRTVSRALRRLLPMHEDAREVLIRRTIELVFVGVAAAGVVAVTQGVLGGLAFWLVGIESPVFWGVVTALLCLLPFGAWIVWLPAAVLLVVSGDVGRGLTLAVIGAVVVSGVDNVLRPALVSGRSHMNGLVILVGLLGGVAVFGALGLVIGPVILATALALVGTYVELPAHDAWRE